MVRGCVKLDELLPAVRALRVMGASVIKLGADGSVVLAFDAPLAAGEERETANPAPDESDALFDSAD